MEVVGDIWPRSSNPKPRRQTELILLDTHAWVWLAMDPKRLSRAALAAMRRSIESGGICVASISLL